MDTVPDAFAQHEEARKLGEIDAMLAGAVAVIAAGPADTIESGPGFGKAVPVQRFARVSGKCLAYQPFKAAFRGVGRHAVN